MRRTVVGIIACHLAFTGLAMAQAWEDQTSGTTNVLTGVWFADPTRGVAVGENGTVLETEDGGVTWSPLLLTTDDMLDAAFLDDAIGLIVGDNGTIFRTTDAGQDWTQVTSGTVNNLAGVAFGGAGLAYAVGRDGTILRSSDAGAGWSVAETGAARYRAVSAVGSRAWVVGNDGVLRLTEDGGATWSSLDSGTDSDLHDVIFVSESEGWTVGQNNSVFYTDDGGATWTSRNGSIGIGLNSVFFGNSTLGWTGGRLGNAFHSADGALSWDGEPTPTLDELNAIHFADAFHGWAVGENGTILTRRVPSTDLSLDGDTLEWDAVAGEPTYGVVRGDLETLLDTAGDFIMATEQCLGQTSLTQMEFSADPTIAGEGFWFLVRVNLDGGVGTYDSGSFLQTAPRDVEIALSGFDCP